MERPPSNSAGDSFLEMLRAFGLIVIIDLAGALLAIIIQAVHGAVMMGNGSVDFGVFFGGGLIGHLMNVVAIPCLWWKDLRKALPLTFGPIALLAAMLAAFQPVAVAGMLTALVGGVWLIAVAFILPKEREVLRIGLCPACGYSLRGNRSGRCPECGASMLSRGAADGPSAQQESATSA